MTRIETIKECLDMWTWIHDNYKHYQQYPNVTIHSMKRMYEEFAGKHFDNMCPCCEFVHENSCDCIDCPLVRLWAEGCMTEGPFLRLHNSPQSEWAEWIDEIITECERILDAYQN